MAELIAIVGDKTDLGGAAFKTPSDHKVFVGGKLAIRKGDAAEPEVNGRTDTEADEASEKVFIGGERVHRNNDRRKHGAKTVATDNKVFVG